MIAAFIYLRIIVAMYLSDAPEGGAAPVRVPWTAGLALLVAVVFTIGAGVLPERVVDFAHDAVPSLVASD